MSLLAKVRVRVPASTSNIGPGFDCLGMALGLYNELVVEMHSEKGPLSFEIEGEGAETLPRDRGNVMFRAANTVLAGRFPNRLVFKAVNRIPLARGLGSSAAAIVAGLFAANRLIKPSPLTQEQLFEYALVLEGHPDNIAAAIFGGVTLSIKDRRDVRNHALKPHKDLVAVVCIPEFQLETAKARAVLPDIVPREAAVENVSRAMLLASAMERGRWKDLAAAMGDRLHQPYRACLVPGFKDVLKAAHDAGICGAALSGSGPTVLALCRKGPQAQAIGEAMVRAFAQNRIKSRALVLPIDHQGVKVWAS
ncbi:MAG TPA: homoserine kinase [Elusimicrobia bacterium]|nr:homoserine kinase [Elusimicrobiota bacterium]HBT61538.1 homoserine kinase [Elusimicrobiota bacterium]